MTYSKMLRKPEIQRTMIKKETSIFNCVEEPMHSVMNNNVVLCFSIMNIEIFLFNTSFNYHF